MEEFAGEKDGKAGAESAERSEALEPWDVSEN
jgi:hypothetical protein